MEDSSNCGGALSRETPPFRVGLYNQEESMSDPIVVIGAAMYPSLEDARFQCTVEMCELAAKVGVPIVCVDDSPSDLHEQVKNVMETKGRGWVRVMRMKGKGKKGSAIRQALSFATRWRRDPSQRWAVAFSELEKVDYMNYVKMACEPILANQADIVTPGRDPTLFRETYAIEQYHSETLGNKYLNMIWKREGGTCEPDWLFGPICWEGNLVGPFYLRYTAEAWDAQIVPAIRASRMVGARWDVVRIPYKHHHLQKDEEEGSLEFADKRILQLNLMTSILGRAMETAGRLRTIIIAGVAGNIGQKIAKCLLTATSSSKSSKVLGESEEKYRLVLMDSAPCPPTLDLTNTNGHQVEYVICDFSQYEQSWAKLFSSAYVAFLLAAKNPFPEATSQDAYASMVINSNLLEACANGKVDRVVFASSNHLVGGLLNEKGRISPDASPNFGTKYQVTGASMDSTLYASAKAAGEAQIRAMVAAGRLPRAIILRIGWCQPGENLLSTISITGTPTLKESPADENNKRQKQEEEDKAFILSWFRQMHLKNEDLDRIVDSCISPALDTKPNKLIYVNAMSAYPNSRWIVTNNELGYIPSPI